MGLQSGRGATCRQVPALSLSLLVFTPVCAAGAVPRVGSCSGDCNLLAINLVNSKFVKWVTHTSSIVTRVIISRHSVAETGCGPTVLPCVTPNTISKVTGEPNKQISCTLFKYTRNGGRFVLNLQLPSSSRTDLLSWDLFVAEVSFHLEGNLDSAAHTILFRIQPTAG